MLGMGVNRGSIGLFDNLTAEHDDDIMADMFHNCKIVRDKQVRKPKLILEILQQIDDLGLNTDVQGAHNFIAHNEFWLDGQGASDPDALTLAAAELMRKSAEMIGRKADFF